MQKIFKLLKKQKQKTSVREFLLMTSWWTSKKPFAFSYVDVFASYACLGLQS